MAREYVELSATARKICKENYKQNCEGCALRSLCVYRNANSYESYNQWVSDINQKAEELKGREQNEQVC